MPSPIYALIAKAAVAAAAPPVLTSLDYDLADYAGGDVITAKGTNLASASECTLGAAEVASSGTIPTAAATITANTASTVAFQMPTSIPGLPIPDLDGVNDSLTPPGTLASYVSAGAFAGWALVSLDSISLDNNSANNDTIIGAVGSQRFGVFVRSSGRAGVYIYNGAVEQRATTNANTLPLGRLALVQWNLDAGTLKIRVNGGPWESTTATSIDNLTYAVVIGSWTGSGNFLNGRIVELAIAATGFSDETHDNVAAYVAYYFALDFPEITPAAFDPRTLALTGYWRRGGYALGTWTGVASEGPSGGRNATEGTNPPAVVSPMLPGRYDVKVTTPGGVSNALEIEVWSPATATSATVRHRWRPDQGVTPGSGSGIAVLSDLVGAMHQRQPTAANQPILIASDSAYGNKPVLHGDGATSKFFTADTTTAIASPASMMVIGQIDSPTRSFIAANGSPYNMLWRNGNATVALDDDSLEFYGTAGALKGPATSEIAEPGVVITTDGGSSTRADANLLFHNNPVPKAVGIRRWGSATAMHLMLGAAGVQNLVGKEAEVVLWSGELSAGDVMRALKYAEARNRLGRYFLTSDVADTLGGDLVTVFGPLLAGATATLDGAPVFSTTTSFTLTFVMPPKSPGTYTLAVTRSDGTIKNFTIEAWNPGIEAGCTLFCEAPDYAAGTWVRRVGTSNPSFAGSAVPAKNGAPNFDGSGHLVTGENTNVLIGATGGTIATVARPTTMASESVSTTPYNNTSMIVSKFGTGPLGIYNAWINAGVDHVVGFFGYDSVAGTYKSARRVVRYFLHSHHAMVGTYVPAGAMSLSVDGSPLAEATATLSGHTDHASLGPLAIGANYAGTRSYRGTVRAIATYSQSKTDTFATKFAKWARTRHYVHGVLAA